MTVSYTILCYQVTDLFPKEGQLCEKLRRWKWLKQSGYSVTEWDPAGPLAANEWGFWGVIRFPDVSSLPWGKWQRSGEWQHLQVTDARIHQASVHTVTQAVTIVSQLVKPDCIFIFRTKSKVGGPKLFFIPFIVASCIERKQEVVWRLESNYNTKPSSCRTATSLQRLQVEVESRQSTTTNIVYIREKWSFCQSGWITEIGIHPVDPSCKPPAWFVFHWLGFDYLTSEHSPCEGRWHQRVSFEKRYCHLSNLSNNVYVVILQLILQHHFLINKRAIIGTKAMSGSLF